MVSNITIQMAVLIETSLGDIVIDLFYKERPNCQFIFLPLDLALAFVIHNIIITLSLVFFKLRLGLLINGALFFFCRIRYQLIDEIPIAIPSVFFSPKSHFQTESSTLNKYPKNIEDS